MDAVLAWIILGTLNLNWRIFYFATSLVPLFVAQMISLWVPESPNFLILHGHRTALQEDLAKLDFAEWEPPAGLAFLLVAVDEQSSGMVDEGDKATLRALLRGPWRISLALLSAICFCIAYAW